MKISYDLIVIGSGPAGQRAALQTAKAGKKVVMIESHAAVGGGCVHTGTLPSKSFRESVYRWSLGSQGQLGQEASQPKVVQKKDTRITPSGILLPDIQRLLKRKERVVQSESKIIFDQLTRNDVKIVHGIARLASKNEVEVTHREGKTRFVGEVIVIATGASPIAPENIPVDDDKVFDSDSIFNLKETPEKIIILGAGVIGCEYTSIFSMAGTQVTLIDKRPDILASVDREIVNHLVERYEDSGVKLVLNSETRAIHYEKTSKGVTFHMADGKHIEADCALVALGRQGNTKGLGLEEVGVEVDERGQIKVNEYFQTTVRNIYAAGDVIGFPALAATSMEQGRIAVCNAFRFESEIGTTFPKHFPFGIYTIPEISIVGETEEQLKARGVDYVAGRARYKELARGQIVGDRWGLLKMLVDRNSLKVYGVHIVGDNAAELVHIGQAVMVLGGDASYFVKHVFNYPTLAEAYKTAAFHAINQIRGTTKTR